MQSSGLAGQGGPIGLNGVVQYLLGLHDVVYPHIKSKTDAVAGVDAVGNVPTEDGLVGTQSDGIDAVRRIDAAHIARKGQVAAGEVI